MHEGFKKSSINVCCLRKFFIGLKEFQKNLYHETFLVYFDLLLKRNHANLYPPNCIIKLKYYFNRPISKYNIFTKHPNYFKKMFYLFLPSIRMSRKSINFEDKKINKSNFYKNKKLFKIEDIDINNILVSKKNHMVQKFT